MILLKSGILEAINDGSIAIDPFNPNQLNPNSYDLRLADTVISYRKSMVLDCANGDYDKSENYVKQKIEQTGLTLYPGHLYLMATKEYTATNAYVPMIEGRSSIARLGICIHNTAGFGDIGFNGTWTLEVSVINPVVIYSDMRICQLYFLLPNTSPKEISDFYRGKYNGQKEPKTSKIYLESNEWVR
jgi:dCTP deaminase